MQTFINASLILNEGKDEKYRISKTKKKWGDQYYQL